MNWSKALHYIVICLILLFSVLGGLGGERAVHAIQESGEGSFLSALNQEESSPEDKLELVCRYPTFEGKSGDSFEFEINLRWLGDSPRTFDLAITESPPMWNATIVAGAPEKTIFGIGLEAEMQWPETIRVKFAPVAGELPEPGEYVVILAASSGDIEETVELKAIVTAQYRFAFYTATGRLNTEVTGGQENHLAVEVANTGTAALNEISFTSSKPSGWTITFNPDMIDSLAPGMAKAVDVIIEPPSKTIAGDYLVTMTAINEELLATPREIELRVTALTPTIWGWVGVIIVLVVIAALGVIFRRLGRR
jgi:uncharacterized membrane protein